MKSSSLSKIRKDLLKDLIRGCTETQQYVFKRMYTKDVTKDINTVIDEMDESKIEWAISQVERTLNKK